MTEALYLASNEVAELADLPMYIDTVQAAYEGYADTGVNGAETKLHRNTPDGTYMYYGAILPEQGVMGTFSYAGGFAPDDAWFLTTVADSETGEPLAIVDSAVINPSKTGATGAVGTDILARADASTVGIIGTGRQAESQLRATNHVRDLDRVMVFSPTTAHRQEFVTRLNADLDATVRAVESATAAINGADIIITATTSSVPVIEDDAIAPGTHITAMGATTPDTRELPTQTIERATYVPDVRERAIEMSGELNIAIAEGAITTDHIHATLSEALTKDGVGRTRDDEITVFDMGGTGIETIAAAAMVYRQAREQGDLGVLIDIVPRSEAFDR